MTAANLIVTIVKLNFQQECFESYLHTAYRGTEGWGVGWWGSGGYLLPKLSLGGGAKYS